MNTPLQIKYNPLWLWGGIIYLFFNTLFLPEGLYFTTLLSPLFFIGLVKSKGLKYYAYFFCVTFLFALIQFYKVQHLTDYTVSFMLLQTLAVFIIYMAECMPSVSLSELYKSLAAVNMLLLIPALITLFIIPLRPIMWYLIPISNNIPIIPRLKMFTSEASYYSLIITPVFAYYLLSKILLKNAHNMLFFSLCISLILSFSLGVLIVTVFSLVCILIFNWNNVRFKTNLSFLLSSAFVLMILFIGLYYFFPHNPLFERIKNIYTGQDTSSRGRTYEAFHIAWNVIKLKSVWFGCGLGQFKYIGKDFLDYYYMYSKLPTSTPRIPNAVAETLCIYGIAGIVIRFSLIIFFFIKTKVWTNYYRQFLFLFIFIYQFTGSYLFNPAEYMMWVLAFSPSILPQFKKEKFNYKLVME